jgi:hypothetical protein
VRGDAAVPPVVAEVVDCRTEAGRTLAEIELRPAGARRNDLTGLIPIAVLRSLEYQGPGSAPVRVGGYPPAPGAIDLMPPPASGVRVEDRAPPRALLSFPAKGGLILRNVLLTVPGTVSLAAETPADLVGAQAATPLGRLTVTDARLLGHSLHVRLRHAWRGGLGDGSGLLPKGALLAQLRVGSVWAAAEAGFVVGSGADQDLTFALPGPAHGSVRLLLGGWGILVPGPIRLPADACSGP